MREIPVGLIFKVLSTAAAIIHHYRELKYRKDWSFVVVSESKDGGQLFTNGCVLSLSWLKLEVMIEGYQVHAPCTSHGKFKIKIWDIGRINDRVSDHDPVR
jgi:hypothetical protein